MIYLIVDENKNFCKIGFTENISIRLTTLQIGNPLKLFVLSVIDGSEEDEIKIHQMFSHLHKRGEWFLFMKEILDFFNSNPQEKIETFHSQYKAGIIKSPKYKDEDILSKINFPCTASQLDEQISKITKMSIPTARNIKKRFAEEGKIKSSKEGKNEIYNIV